MIEHNEIVKQPETSPASAEMPPWERFRPETNQFAANGFSAGQLARGLLFGILFGFLLQKGGVAKYHILIGALLLEDLAVVNVMDASGGVVGLMAGSYLCAEMSGLLGRTTMKWGDHGTLRLP